MPNLVLQTNIKAANSINALFEDSNIKAKKYAEKTGADYHCITDYRYLPGFDASWQRFGMFTSDFSKYDKILYVDSDLLLLDHAPDLFKLLDEYGQEIAAAPDYTSIEARAYTGYFNAGLFLSTKRWRNSLSIDAVEEAKTLFKNTLCYDQDGLNLLVKNSLPSYLQLDRAWNSMTDKVGNFKYVYGVHFIHIRKANYNKETIATLSTELLDPSAKVFTFPEWWRNLSFKGILDMEAKYNSWKK